MRSGAEELMWNQFIRLGEMIGDGDHWEDPWIEKEYKRLAKILIPKSDEEKSAAKEKRQEINNMIDGKIEEKLKTDTCNKCQGELKQTRSGALIGECVECGAKFQYKYKK